MVKESFPRQGLTGPLLAPLLVGLGYSLARNFAGGWVWTGIYLQSPLVVSSFSGLVMAMACRPVLMRIPWSRMVAAGLGVAIILGCGRFADWLIAWLGDMARIAPFPLELTGRGAPDFFGGLAAALLMGLLFRPGGGKINQTNLKVRLEEKGARSWAGRVALLATATVGLWLLLGWLDVALNGTPGDALGLLIIPNPWMRLTGTSLEMGGLTANGAGQYWFAPDGLRAPLMLALYWVRGLALFLPLLPIALVLRATVGQLLVVFSLLLFVVGDFGPLIQDQPYSSTMWLLSRTALGIARSVILAAFAVKLIGQVKE